MPYYPELSGDTLFWNITIERKEIIPQLIDHIDDTVMTSANVPNFGGVYTVWDVCVSANAVPLTASYYFKLVKSV